MKSGVGAFPGVSCCSTFSRSRTEALVALKAPLHGHFPGVCLVLPKLNVEQKLWVYRMCWERTSTASVCASQGWTECSNESS